MTLHECVCDNGGSERVSKRGFEHPPPPACVCVCVSVYVVYCVYVFKPCSDQSPRWEGRHDKHRPQGAHVLPLLHANVLCETVI